MVMEETYLSQHQSLVLAEAEVPPTSGSKCSSCGRVHGENVCPARNSVCFSCNKKGHFKMMCHSSRRTQSWSHPSSSSQHKVVQEVCTHDDQNTGNKTKNVDIVEMIRSMGLHAKNPLQTAIVQEMSIVHVQDTKPVFYSPVQPMIVMTIWDQVCGVMDPKVCVATPVEHCVYENKANQAKHGTEECSLLKCNHQWTDGTSKTRHWG